MLDLATKIRDKVSPSKKILSNKIYNSQMNNYIPDTSKAKALGCEEWTSIDESIFELYEFYKR